MKLNLAIVAQSLNAYTETFIQAHKEIQGMNVRYYYGDPLPTMLENYGVLEKNKWFSTLYHYTRKMIASPFNDRREDVFAWSLRKEKIDCVLAEYGTTGANILTVCKSLRIPLVVTFLGYDASVHQILRQYEFAYKDLFNYASAVIVVSRSIQEKLKSLGCPAEKIRYSPTGPHDRFFSVTPDFSQKLFISTGRFVDKKAHYYTILAFNEVLKQHPDARLVIAGEGALINVCINLIRFLKIEYAVSFPRVITLEEFSEYLSVARAYVQHSITAMDGDMEGTPVAILEASAAGVPVISTRHAGIPDVVVDGETGFLVDEHDVLGMSKHMLNVLENEQLARKVGANGRTFVGKNFNREAHLEMIARTVEDAVSTGIDSRIY
ncbi:MAG: glycosyltransferase [Candidatus Kapabacteria bacterium]|nr:glycosyltransferase [Candidatus Kapabacteria bacterium]